MTSYAIAKKYVALVRAGQREECIGTLFAPDAVSVEAVQLPGREQTVRGVEGILGKSKFFLAHNEVHKAELFGPYPHGDRFAVRFVFDLTFKPTGQRRTMDEVGLFTVAEDKIVREEFFYALSE